MDLTLKNFPKFQEIIYLHENVLEVLAAIYKFKRFYRDELLINRDVRYNS